MCYTIKEMEIKVFEQIKFGCIGIVLTAMIGVCSVEMVWAQTEIGVWLGTSTPSGKDIKNFEKKIGKHVSSVLVFQGMYPGGVSPIPLSIFKSILCHDGYNTHTSLHFTLEPWVSLDSISSGFYDRVFEGLAQKLSSYPGEVRFRFAHEMIQDDDPNTSGWYPWQDRPEEYKKAYTHVYDLFRSSGADNVRFVWSPNHHLADPQVLAKYYPGKEYVDWIGLDGYEWYPGESFDDIFSAIYKAITEHPEIFGDKDIMLAEFAAMEGGDKALWIQDAFNKIKDEYVKIKAFYWFNEKKERDWRVDSSAESLESFRDAMDDPYFVGHSQDPSDPCPYKKKNIFGGRADIEIQVEIPRVNQLRLVISRVNPDNSWSKEEEIDFGRLEFDEKYRIFRSRVYFVMDVGIACNSGDWKLIYEATPLVSSNGGDLSNHINVTFCSIEGGSERVIDRVAYSDSHKEFSRTQLEGRWLRVYYGIATGLNDAPGVTPISLDQPAGRYQGAVVVSLVLN